MNKVLVTGGAGLIGFHAAKYYLERGWHVDILDNLERSTLLGHKVSDERIYHNINLLTRMGANWWCRDVSRADSFHSLPAYDLIVHLAGQCGVPTSIARPRRDMEINLIGTFNVLEHARMHGSTVTFSSTNKVYPIHDSFEKWDNRWVFDQEEWRKYGFPIIESLHGSRTPYGWSKFAADKLCHEYAHTYGVKTGVFRMSCIYGPNQMGFEEQGWATWFAIATLKELPITIYGDGSQVRDMLYVTDCVKAYDAFYQSGLQHGTYNLGGGPGASISLHDALDILFAATGKRSVVTYKDWRPLDQKCYISDIRKVHEELKWDVSVLPAAGYDKVIKWVNQNLTIF